MSTREPENESTSESLFTTVGSVPGIAAAADAPTKKIFISYRRADSAGYAGRLFDRLANHFGREDVFMDVDAIGAGADFIHALETAVGSCAVVVVLVGQRWLNLEAEDGTRRLDNPEDFVRLEVQTGLSLGRVVIPTLVDGASMPGFDDLPEPLVGLARRNAVEVSNNRWDYDVGRLIGAIEAAGIAPSKKKAGKGKLLAAAAVVAIVAAGAWFGLRSEAPTETVGQSGPPVAEEEPIVARPTVAILGLETTAEEGSETSWLTTAAAEILGAVLGLDDAVRAVSAPDVAAARQGLGLPEGALPNEDLVRLGQAVAADYVLEGRVDPLSTGELSMVRIAVTLRAAGDGQTLLEGKSTGMATELHEVVGRAMSPELRERLGMAKRGNDETLVIKASMPKDPRAARLYNEGLEALRRLDAPAARDLFERAVEAESDHPLPHSGLASAWAALGYKVKAEEEAKRAMDLGENLSEVAQLLLKGQHAELAQDWPAAIRTYQELFQGHPDDIALGLRLADIQISAGRTAEAIEVLGQLREIPSTVAEDPRIDLMEARASYRSGDSAGSEAAAARAKQKSIGTGDELATARALFWLGRAWIDTGRVEESEEALQEARSLFEKHGDARGVAETLELVAELAFRSGDLEGARRLDEKALDAYRNLGDRLGMARVLANIGLNLRRFGHTQESEVYLQQAQETAIDIGARYEAAHILNEVAVLEHVSGRLASARQGYGKALALYTEIGYRRGMAAVLTNLGEVAFLEDRMDESESFHQESLATNREIGDKSGIAYDTHRLALIALARSQLTVAKNGFAEALELDEELDDDYSAAEAKIGMARVERAAGNPEAGTILAREAAEILEAEGATDLEIVALSELGCDLLAEGNLAEAYNVLKEVLDRAGESEDLGARHSALLLEAGLAMTPDASGEVDDVAGRLARFSDEVEAAGHRRKKQELEAAVAALRGETVENKSVCLPSAG